jgi:hypothetical protein
MPRPALRLNGADKFLSRQQRRPAPCRRRDFPGWRTANNGPDSVYSRAASTCQRAIARHARDRACITTFQCFFLSSASCLKNSHQRCQISWVGGTEPMGLLRVDGASEMEGIDRPGWQALRTR